jgi:hypothetical protein
MLLPASLKLSIPRFTFGEPEQLFFSSHVWDQYEGNAKTVADRLRLFVADYGMNDAMAVRYTVDTTAVFQAPVAEAVPALAETFEFSVDQKPLFDGATPADVKPYFVVGFQTAAGSRFTGGDVDLKVWTTKAIVFDEFAMTLRGRYYDEQGQVHAPALPHLLRTALTDIAHLCIFDITQMQFESAPERNYMLIKVSCIGVYGGENILAQIMVRSPLY